MRTFYAILCLAGVLLPFAPLEPWIATHGFALDLLAREAFAAPISAFAWADVIVSGCVLVPFILAEGRRLRMSFLWLPIAGLLLVGVSLSLPLFLWMREPHVVRERRGGSPAER